MTSPSSAGVAAAPLAQALTMTRAMLAAAQLGDWDQLLRLEESREPLLRRQHAADPDTQAQLGQILACDRQLQALLGKARDAVARQWQEERGRAQAIAAYVQR